MITEVKGDIFVIGPRIVYNGVNTSGESENSFIGREGQQCRVKDQFAAYKRYCENHGNSMLGLVTYSDAEVGDRAIVLANGYVFTREHDMDALDFKALSVSLKKLAAYAEVHGESVAIPAYLGYNLSDDVWSYVRDKVIRPVFDRINIKVIIVYKDTEAL